MKKVMIALAAVAVALTAGAAHSETYVVNNLNGYDKYYITIVNARTSVSDFQNMDETAKNTLADYFLTKDDSVSWTEHYASLASSWQKGMGKVDGTSATIDPSWTVTVYYEKVSAVFMALKDGIAAGSEYVMFETVYWTGSSSSTFTFDMTDAQVLQKGYLMTDAVPEPTGGLLMLVGMAGLALRRKRA